MNDHELTSDLAATDEELREARLLAAALESSTAVPADAEALAVARLLEVVRLETGEDEVSRRRLRRELAARVRPRHRQPWLAVAAAACLLAAAALGVLVTRSTHSPTPDILAQREQTARHAVAGLIAASSARTRSGDRVARALDDEWRTHFDAALRSERFACLTVGADGGASALTRGTTSRSTPTVPTPGGVS